MRPRCRQCGRTVRSRGIHLYETPKGPVYVCGKPCLSAYNDLADIEPCNCGMHAAEPRPPRRHRPYRRHPERP